MCQIDAFGRPEPPHAGDEVGTLVGFLDYQRATLAWKCGSLDAAGLATPISSSSLTLGGLLKHMALIEVDWFLRDLHGHELGAPWTAVEYSELPEWAWTSANEDSPEQLRALWQESVEQARAATTGALNDDGLATLAARAWPDGRRPSLRWILVHMIEEYARHNGHADLLREAVDGRVGE